MLIDTHCHIHDRSTYNYAFSRQQIGKKLLKKYPDLPHLPADFVPERIIARAHAADVKKMICIGTTHEDSLAARDFALSHLADGVYWAYGIHPDEADQLDFNYLSALTQIVRTEAAQPKKFSQVTDSPISLVAIGEVGLDYRNGTGDRKNQISLFEQMLHLAKECNLPLIFHIREAFDDFFAVLHNFPDTRGVVHSYSDNRENLQKSLSKGFFIGVNGLATFAPELPTSEIPLDRMLLETDAPFLTPAPFRGTINEPARVREICAYISNITGESEATIAKITTENAEKLFKI